VEIGERRGEGRSYGVGRVVVRLGRTIFPPDLNSVSRFGGREMADIVTQFLKLENFQVERERERLSGGGWISLKREEECCWWWGALQM
jgi:hypothetical protein